MNKKELICPICKRKFVTKRHNQRYCGTGCYDTARKIQEIKRITVYRIGQVFEDGEQ